MLQGQSVYFIQNAEIRRGNVLIACDARVLLQVGSDTTWVNLTEVYTTDNAAMQAYIQNYGFFPLSNATSLRVDIELEVEPLVYSG